jgi:hypothetical protein
VCAGAGETEEGKNIMEMMIDDVGFAEVSFIMALVWATADRIPRISDPNTAALSLLVTLNLLYVGPKFKSPKCSLLNLTAKKKNLHGETV